MKNYRKNPVFRSLLATTLLINGTFQLAAPVLADGTPAGTSISNTATATYDDGNGQAITTQSNTVQITVAEVAGVTVSNAGYDNQTLSGDALRPGNTANFKFKVTNVGNDATTFFIPSATVLNGANAVINASATDVTYVVLNPNGTVNTTLTPTPVAVTGNGIQTTSIPPQGQIQVNVKVTVPTSATGDVSVTLGNTTSQNGQNVTRATNPNDVYTVDNPNGAAGETAGAPVNGVREASSKQTVTLNATALQPFVNIQTTHAPTATAGGASGPQDDTLGYDLTLKVLSDAEFQTLKNQSPGSVPSGVTGADNLQPTFVPGLSTPGDPTTNQVLVADVLPEGTVLDNTTITPPTNWTVVYSTDDPVVTGNSSYKATWSATAPNDLTQVKRIGFVYTANTAIPKGTTTQPLSFRVKFTSAVQQGSQIANMAEVFGEKTGATPSATTVPTIFDQSGDTSVNNDSNNDGVSDTTPNQSTGIASTASLGSDSSNNNTGSGPGGEANAYSVPVAAGTVENGTYISSGPNAGAHPDAVGPGSNSNTDFTNLSSTVGPNSVPLVAFTNSVRNSANGNVRFIPLATNLTDLPVGQTVITIGDTSGTKVTYTVTQTTPGGVPTVTPSGSPLTITVTGGTPVQYEVTVDLPNNATQNTGYDVPITAFIDTNNNGVPDGSESQNITIDRVYAGFIQLLKETSIVGATDGRQTFSVAPKAAAPGEIIQYRITYTNISESNAGTNSVLLNGYNLKITEDGINGGNNWATDQNGDAIIDTSHMGGGVTLDSTNGSTNGNGNGIEYFNGLTSLGNTEPLTNTVVTRYIDTVTGTLAPNVPQSFTFQRKVN